jgi:hypothetical protein
MTAWHVQRTRDAIERVYGRSQLDLAAPCLRSLGDRQFYARFHYQRAEATLKRYIRAHLNDQELMLAVLGANPPASYRFNVAIRKMAADITASVQSLHAIPDILASSAYYSLALDQKIKPKGRRFVNHRFVTDSIANIPQLQSVHAGLRTAAEDEPYKHLAALANQSKHYSIVFPALNIDLTGERPERHSLVFPAFKVRGIQYPQVFVTEFLPPIYEQISAAVLATGHAIHACLQELSL